MTKETVSLLDVDADLGADLSPSERERAQRILTVSTIRVEAGRWNAHALGPPAKSLFGVLIAQGRMRRSLSLGARETTHLFGPGDVIRPWDDDDTVCPLPADPRWSAIEDAELALLDRRFVAAAAGWPPILIELSRRSSRQSSRTMLQAAIAAVPRVDHRVLLLLWRLGERWGRMTPAGILLPIPLTHQTIAGLIGARRPAVTSALTALGREELVQRRDDGWLIDRGAEQTLRDAFRTRSTGRFVRDPVDADGVAAV